VADQSSAIPVDIITGFLGSGKTTLLQRLLAAPELADTAVLVNEFGEVGLDHHLLRPVSGDVVLLPSGCLCCTIREDIGAAIRDLYARRECGEIPPFRRLVIETTGLADPVPILSTVSAEPVIRHHFRLGNVITTVDAVNAASYLDRQPESVKQVAVADRIILTKTDVASGEDLAKLERRLQSLNPSVPRLTSTADSQVDAAFLMKEDAFDSANKLTEVRRWLEFTGGEATGPEHHHDADHHLEGIHTFCLRIEGAFDWMAFGIWLSMLLHARGDDVLRVKGIVNIGGENPPVVIHGVQRLVHPPVHLREWPDDDRATRIVFIVRGIERALIERSLAAFGRLARPAADAA
jgi:G3E family GTPase